MDHRFAIINSFHHDRLIDHPPTLSTRSAGQVSVMRRERSVFELESCKHRNVAVPCCQFDAC